MSHRNLLAISFLVYRCPSHFLSGIEIFFEIGQLNIWGLSKFGLIIWGSEKIS